MISDQFYSICLKKYFLGYSKKGRVINNFYDLFNACKGVLKIRNDVYKKCFER